MAHAPPADDRKPTWRFILTCGLALLLVLAAEALFLVAREGSNPTQTAAASHPPLPAVIMGGALSDGTSVRLQLVAEGLTDPVAVIDAGDGSGRLFVAERAGRVMVIRGSDLQPEPLIDIRSKVASEFLEQGLLGLAVDPAFAETGRLFLSYTELLTGGDTVVEEYVVPADGTGVNVEDALVRIRFDRPSAGNNGGTIHFGADGFLYIGSGDGGFLGYTWNATAQEPSTLFGKILRIDVNTPSSLAYRIPQDNPFAQPDDLDRATPYADGPPAAVPPVTDQPRPEIWSLGLRNPWQFSFDPETSDMYIPDVGQETREEVNYEPAGIEGGLNYGWHIFEGTICLPGREAEECSRSLTQPVAEYARDDGNCSVSGIGVYRGIALPSLAGHYIFGDWCSGKIWELFRDDSQQWTTTDLFDTNLRVTGGGTDGSGELLVLSCVCDVAADGSTLLGGGAIWRLEP